MKSEIVFDQDIIHSDDKTALDRIHKFCKESFGEDGQETDPYEGSWLKYQCSIGDLSRSQYLKLLDFCEEHFVVGEA